MGRRHGGHAFMPGKWVFPGGGIDRADFAVPAATELAGHVAAALAPGSIIVELDPEARTLYAHVLSASDAASVEAFRQRALDVEASLIRAVGRPADLALLASPHEELR